MVLVRASLALTLTLLLIGAGCRPSGGGGGEGPGHRAQSLALTPQQEVSLGEQAFREVLGKAHVVRSGPAVERVQTVGRRIARAAEIKPLQKEINLRMEDAGYTFEWEFAVVESREVNAFCLPGGKVVVFTHLLDVATTDDELATVLGHEIAHALAHHASERVAREQMHDRALSAVNGALGALDPRERERLIALLGFGTKAYSLKYDRAQEAEADHIGLFLMTFADYDPRAAVTFWEKMERLGGASPPEILSDHPSNAHRIAAIRQWAEKALAAKAAWKAGRVVRGG